MPELCIDVNITDFFLNATAKPANKIDNVFQQSCSFSFWALCQILEINRSKCPELPPLSTIWQIQPCLATVLRRRRATWEG